MRDRVVGASYDTLRRFAMDELGWRKRPATVRVDDTPPGQVTQIDFGKVGVVRDPVRGGRAASRSSRSRSRTRSAFCDALSWGIAALVTSATRRAGSTCILDPCMFKAGSVVLHTFAAYMTTPMDSARVDEPRPPRPPRNEEHFGYVRLDCERMGPGAARLEGVRVLVVDDEPDTRELLRVALEREGATVATTASVSEALAHIERVSPHVLVCDIAMPERDGYELLRVVRSLPSQQVARTSAIALTGLPEKVARERAYGAGYDAYMVKPVEFSQFIATVARFASWYAAA